MNKCKKCGTEFESAFCPNCGTSATETATIKTQTGTSNAFVTKPDGTKIIRTQPAKKSNAGKIVLIVVGVIVLLGVIGSLGSEKNNDNKQANALKEESVTVEQSSESKVQEEVNTTKEKDNDQLVFSIGDIAEYKDVQISFLGYSESEGNDWGEPASGNVFVLPEFEVVNNSDKEIIISSMVSFDCYCDDYKVDFSSKAFMAISTEDGIDQLDGDIAPGKKLKGVLGIEVPSDWKKIEIYYKDNAWLDSNFSFVIEK